jgi:hypothetical protein
LVRRGRNPEQGSEQQDQRTSAPSKRLCDNHSILPSLEVVFCSGLFHN